MPHTSAVEQARRATAGTARSDCVADDLSGAQPFVRRSGSAQAVGIEQEVAAAGLQLAYSRLPQSILMAVIVGFGFLGLLSPFFPVPRLLTWLGLLATAYAVRLVDWYAWKRARPTPAQTRRWRIHFALGAVVAGGSWAFGAVQLLGGAGHLESMLLIVSVLTVSATAANTLASQFFASVLFVGSAILPVAAALALTAGGAVERMTALAMLCCFLVLCIAGRQSSRTTQQLIRTELGLSRAVADTEAAQRLAEASSLAKSQFLANMSHEVRTPLNGVLGLAELLGRGQLSAQQHTQVQLLRQSGEHLLRIVNEILDLSKIEAGRLDLVSGEFDLRALLQECAELVRPLAEHKGLQFELRLAPEVPGAVAGDAHRIRQVLLNLLSNATKFTEHGSVSLSVACEAAQPHGASAHAAVARIRFDIEDTGIGVSRRDAERIFDAFTQAEESADRRFTGTGLGLTLCRQLAELMGGTVTYAARPGGGSTFTVLLSLQVGALAGAPSGATHAAAAATRQASATPRAEPPMPAAPTHARLHATAPVSAAPTASAGSSAQAASPQAGPVYPDRYTGRVLLAEDNPVNQEVMLAMLETFGIDVQCVGNGREAVAAAAHGNFDMVLMDCQMPLMDGYTATGAMRAAGARDRRHGPLPIVALTANAFAEDRERALAAGMNDFVAKPVIMDELHRVLATWLPAGGTSTGSGLA